MTGQIIDLNKGSQPKEHIPQPLTIDVARKLAGALARVNELGATAIQTPTIEAEMRGLTEFIANILRDHADEFVSCWFTIQQEYGPLVRAAAVLFRRAADVNNQARQLEQAHAEAVAAAATK